MYKELLEYSKKDIYPFHMPGHKRHLQDSYLGTAAEFDITEIDGFGNFHSEDPGELFEDLYSRICRIFGGKRAWISVNGSTALILAAIHSLVPRGGRILAAAHNHKSVYNAAYLRGAELIKVSAPFLDDLEIEGGMSPELIERHLKEARDESKKIDAVIFPSPTYEGIISDISLISSICHKYNVPLIVDSAHGAHLGLYEGYEKEYNCFDPIKLGADLVIKSLHKTLPSFGQTAIAIQGHQEQQGGESIFDPKQFEFFHKIFQTTSPSYLFFAGIDKCLDIIEKEGAQRFKNLKKWLDDSRSTLNGAVLKDTGAVLSLPGKELIGKDYIMGFDPTKLILKADGLSGKELHEILLKNYKIQDELYRNKICLLLTGMMDDEKGFDRLKTIARD
ncbi:MAG: aminotransferase class I/II-fold pyridoxal phosphate-dependent enzyme [Lachnospiraceae bacterium]|nr:aminotransferase class I/II-fold pyridoxal phosphate-dependent enzyme [Lachnospiraceae bacterium]